MKKVTMLIEAIKESELSLEETMSLIRLCAHKYVDDFKKDEHQQSALLLVAIEEENHIVAVTGHAHTVIEAMGKAIAKSPNFGDIISRSEDLQVMFNKLYARAKEDGVITSEDELNMKGLRILFMDGLVKSLITKSKTKGGHND